MRHSPARAHYEQAMAAAQPAPGSDQTIDKASANAYELMLVKLAEDKRRLKEIKGGEAKAALKKQLLPDYMPWVTGVLEADTGRQDEVLMTIFVWTIDVADFQLAATIGAYAIRHNLVMPDQYQRDVPGVLADEIADITLKNDDDFRAANIDHIERVVGIVADKDLHDQVRAKLNKAYGYALRAAGQPVFARDALAKALHLDAKAGVKKDIEKLDVVIKNLPAGQVAEQTGAEGSA